MLTGLFQDVKFGFRMMAKNPWFTSVAALTLALGIGVNSAGFPLPMGCGGRNFDVAVTRPDRSATSAGTSAKAWLSWTHTLSARADFTVTANGSGQWQANIPDGNRSVSGLSGSFNAVLTNRVGAFSTSKGEMLRPGPTPRAYTKTGQPRPTASRLPG
jgi:hypothetical protein